MKVIIQLTVSQTVEYQVIAVNTSVKWALQMLLKTIEANIPQKYMVVNDDGKHVAPAAMAFEPDAFPNWVVPASTEEPSVTKTLKLNLDAFGPEGKAVIEAIDDYVKTVENRVQVLEQQLTTLQRRLFVDNSPKPTFNWRPPFVFHRDCVPPGYPGYGPGNPPYAIDPVRAFGQPNFGHDRDDVFDGGVDQNAPPYNWAQPGRPRRW